MSKCELCGKEEPTFTHSIGMSFGIRDRLRLICTRCHHELHRKEREAKTKQQINHLIKVSGEQAKQMKIFVEEKVMFD